MIGRNVMKKDKSSPEKCREKRRLGSSGGNSTAGTVSDAKDLRLGNPDKKSRRMPNAMTHYPSSSSESYSSGKVEPRGTAAAAITTTTVKSRQNPIRPVFGSISVSGRMREMEDVLSIKPHLCCPKISDYKPLHFFAVFDGHGGSHVAALCKREMHVFLEEELMRDLGEGADTASTSTECYLQERWRVAIERAFDRMDKVALDTCACGRVGLSCVCESAGLSSDMIGSTAVVGLVTHDRIVVANCGDSRAVLCRDGRAIPLSFDHKPDRPDELARIEAAGGKVSYVNGARVLGILAMSRALGDRFLKPAVIAKPEITFTKRTSDDECLILASDGLWDVLSDDMACDLASRCLREGNCQGNEGNPDEVESQSQSRCSIAAALLTRLALGRRSADNISVVVVDLKRR